MELTVNDVDGSVHRTLKQRHLAMIAIGGAIGTGERIEAVFMSSLRVF